MVELLQVATAVPPHCVEVSDTKSYLERFLSPTAAKRYGRMADGARIHKRYTVVPPDELVKLGPIESRNRVYTTHALSLGGAVARDALATGKTDPNTVTAVLSVSCTGYMMPSLEAHLGRHLGLSPIARRIPISELGCSAGVGAVGLAAELLASASQRNVLLISVEICSPLVQIVEPSTTDVLANLLFGDAAAAAILSTETNGDGPQVLASQSCLWPTVSSTSECA